MNMGLKWPEFSGWHLMPITKKYIRSYIAASYGAALCMIVRQILKQFRGLISWSKERLLNFYHSTVN